MEIKDDYIYIADTAGFCWGVKRAVDIAISTANNTKGPVYTYGPLIHNPQTLVILSKLGINILEDVSNLPETGTVIIRAHGITLKEKEILCRSGLNIVDATCPKVQRIQKIITRNNDKVSNIYIYGDKDHSEVKGLLGYSNGKGIVIDKDNKDSILINSPSILLCQTTVNKKTWEDFTSINSIKYKDLKIYNTICDATTKRQEELREILRIVDYMIIIGGKDSANTQRLFNISMEYKADVIHIENPNEIDKNIIRNRKKIGITAGASTPAFVIQNTKELIQDAKRKKDNLILRSFETIIKFLYLSDIYSAIGISGLCYLFQKWLGLGDSLYPAFIIFFYYWGLLLMNHLLSTQDRILNDFVKVDFYNRYLKLLIIILGLSLSGSIILTIVYNIYSLPILICILGLSYAYQKPIHIIPIKQIRASKDFVFSAALCIISTSVPLLYFEFYSLTLEMVFPAIFIFFTALIRSLIFDIRDMNRDKIFGKETLPILIGKDRTKRLIIILSIILYGILTFSIITINQRLFFLYIPICYIILCMFLYKKRIISKGIFFDFLIETIFVVVFIASMLI